MGTGEISLIVSGLAAVGSIGAVAITYRLGRQRFEHERRLSDLDTARRVLDDAAAGMIRTESSLKVIASRFDDYAQTMPGRVLDESAISTDSVALDQARDELDALAARLLIHFGSEHELVEVYESAATFALDVAYRVELIAEAHEAGPEVWNEKPKIEQAIRQFSLARKSFALIAYRIVGVELRALQLAEKQAQIASTGR